MKTGQKYTWIMKNQCSSKQPIILMVLLILVVLPLLKCVLMLDNKVREDSLCRLVWTTNGLNQSEDKNRFYIDQHRFNINFNIYALLHFVHSEVTIETIWINITQCLLRWLHHYWRYQTVLMLDVSTFLVKRFHWNLLCEK